jgi:DNA-binding NtrC family response regulator
MAGELMLAVQVGLARESPTVLIVEDEVLIRLMIADELRNQGLHVLEASNAEEALTVLESALPVHLLFTDIRMPGRIDGIGLATFARARYPQVKIIMASSHHAEGSVRELADTFLFKPFGLRNMVDQVEKLLAEFRNDAQSA